MRNSPGNRRAHQDQPVEGIPHYLQYHLENPGADVLMAAWQCPAQTSAGARTEQARPTHTTPPGNTYKLLDDSTDS